MNSDHTPAASASAPLAARMGAPEETMRSKPPIALVSSASEGRERRACCCSLRRAVDALEVGEGIRRNQKESEGITCWMKRSMRSRSAPIAPLAHASSSRAATSKRPASHQPAASRRGTCREEIRRNQKESEGIRRSQKESEGITCREESAGDAAHSATRGRARTSRARTEDTRRVERGGGKRERAGRRARTRGGSWKVMGGFRGAGLAISGHGRSWTALGAPGS